MYIYIYFVEQKRILKRIKQMIKGIAEGGRLNEEYFICFLKNALDDKTLGYCSLEQNAWNKNISWELCMVYNKIFIF